MFVLYLGLSLAAAFVLVQRLAPEFPILARLAGASAVSVVLTGWLTFGAAWAAHALGRSDATLVGSWVAMAVNAVVIVLLRSGLDRESLRITRPAALGALGCLLLAAWIMRARLSGSPLRVSRNTWGDTSLHIGIARSFSEGDNFPPTLPIFPGETIRYHFGFDFYAGALERTGLPIGLAFNVPGALAFASIMILVYSLARYLWRSRAAGVVAAALFPTNGSLAFIRYFQKEDSLRSALTPSHWWNHLGYDGGGPYNGDPIAMYWTLNSYLTQTHLMAAMAAVLFVVYALVRYLRGQGGLAGDPAGRFRAEEVSPSLTPGRGAALGLLLGSSFWLNGIVVVVTIMMCTAMFYVFGGRLRATAVPAAVVAGAAFVVFVLGSQADNDAARYVAVAAVLGGMAAAGPLRRSMPVLVVAGGTALPQVVWLNGGVSAGGSLSFHTGYLVEDFDAARAASYWDFTWYWWLNLGLVLPLVVVAAVVGTRADRRLLAAFMIVFVAGNLLAFGRELGGHNHKVFNLWEVLVNVFAGYGLVWCVRTLWRGLPAFGARLGPPVGRGLAVGASGVAGVLLFTSGFLDFMTLKNDPKSEIVGDRAPAMAWIRDHTARDAVFLTAYGQVYTTETLAGRAVYLGGFGPWTAIMGYDNVSREKRIAEVYTAPDRDTACERLRGTGVDYVEISGAERDPARFQLNEQAFRAGFVVAWENNGTTFYDVAASCPGSSASRGPVSADG